MEYIPTEIQDLYVVQPRVFEDERGYFFESYSQQNERAAELQYNWVQDNEAYSERGVLRGLHYQVGAAAQAKLVRVVLGEVQDVVVDLRPESPTYGQHYSIILSAQKKNQLLVPRGFAHGYLVLSEQAIFAYKCDNFYNKSAEGGIIYNDPTIQIPWMIDDMDFKVSEKDRILPQFNAHRPIQ